MERLSAMPDAAEVITVLHPEITPAAAKVPTRKMERQGAWRFRQRLIRSRIVESTNFFFDACRFAATLTQIIEFRTTNVTTTLQLDFRDAGAVGLEYAFHPFTMRNFSDGK
jgi:hypothetical protein